MDGTFAKSTDFVQRHVAGECLLIPLRRRLTEANSLYVLNETGAAIWERLDGTRSRDLQELVNDLLSIQAIHPVHR